MSNNTNPLMRLLRALLSLYRGFRAVILNLLFLFFVLLLLSPLFPQPTLPVPNNTALLLNPAGVIVEQRSQISPSDQILNEAMGSGSSQEVLVQDLLDAINSAAKDAKITSLVIMTDSLQSSGFTSLRDIGKALDAFSDSGKKIYAWAGNYGQAQYYLASHADEIIINPLGAVELQGFGAWQLYYKEALDKLGVNAHIFRVGEYKAAVEPYERSDMSPAAEENYQQFLGELWQLYLQEVALNRGIQTEDLSNFSLHPDEFMTATQGDSALAAQTAGLIDRIESRPATISYLQEQVGKDGESFKHIDFNSYLGRQNSSISASSTDEIALIIASGEIVDGNAAPGTIGSQSLSALIRQASADTSIKALVLRVNSPGGSAFASELIREELQAFRASGRPLVVSMGNVAASGGYWISTAANEIWASHSTITGSIGIYGVLPTFEDSLKLIGVNVDGVGTTPLSGAGSIGKALHPVVASTLQSSVENGYQRFLTLVADARQMTTEEVDQVAQGRVWSGQMAQQLGLVDELGNQQDAIAAAARLAGIERYETTLLEKQLSPFQQLIRDLMDNRTIQVLLPDNLKMLSELPAMSGPQHQQLTLQAIQTRLNILLNSVSRSGNLLHCIECVNIELW